MNEQNQIKTLELLSSVGVNIAKSYLEDTGEDAHLRRQAVKSVLLDLAGSIGKVYNPYKHSNWKWFGNFGIPDVEGKLIIRRKTRPDDSPLWRWEYEGKRVGSRPKTEYHSFTGCIRAGQRWAREHVRL